MERKEQRPDNVAGDSRVDPAADIEEVPASAGTQLVAAGASRALVAVGAGSGVPTDTLARYLVPQRAGDPLGLGITPGDRPAAPPDPDTYDRAKENVSFARSLLSEEERRRVDAEIEKDGFMTIDQVRALVAENTIKGSVESGGLDPEIMALVDARTNYKIFIAGDNIYTREGLYDHYPFHEFNVQPEAIFVQQELGIFPPRKHALKSEELEYVARDVGDETVDFVMIEDLVGKETRKNYKMRRAPLRVVKTKVYIGKERWEDFALLQRFFRGAVRVATAQIAYSGGQPASMPGMFALLTGARAGHAETGDSRLPMIADQATLDAERLAREAEMARREEALRQREEAQRREAEEQRRAMEEIQRKLDTDMKRIEAMLAAVAPRAAAPRAAPQPAAEAATAAAAAATGDVASAYTADEDDSVAL
jgi:hypothetical protein